mmetsp:Transcript_14456/g.20381  ORF Transcript_14456/g.20381 Transcript_14456/m.20381 type:complete len:156 (-) Transcript_14456:245-712(-)
MTSNPSFLFFFILLTVVLMMMVDAHDYSGTYKLTTTQKDGTRLSLLPSSSDKKEDGEVVVVFSFDKLDESRYNLGVKVANTLRAQVSVSQDGTIHLGPVMSTRMMPPPELRPMEQFLTEYLPTLTTMELEEEGNVMKMKGPHVELFMEQQKDWES